MSLTSRVRLPDDPTTSSEDMFSSCLDLLFPDTGSHIIYESESFGCLKLQLSDPQGRDEHFLFAYHLWNSSILLADFISNAHTQERTEATNRWDITGQIVLELGAGSEICTSRDKLWGLCQEVGTGLAGIISAMAGATQVTLTDHPCPSILKILEQM